MLPWTPPLSHVGWTIPDLGGAGILPVPREADTEHGG